MVTGGRNSNATPAQSPNVSCHTHFLHEEKIISPANGLAEVFRFRTMHNDISETKKNINQNFTD